MHLSVEVAEVEKRKSIELAEQQREIEIAGNAGAVATAQSEAERARAEFVRAEESVISARDLERAERAGQVDIAVARANAEQGAIAKVRQAEADQAAAEHHANALRIEVEAEVAAKQLRSAADETRYAIDATGRASLYEAENTQSPESIALARSWQSLNDWKPLFGNRAKPLERIEGIKIVQLSGAGGIGDNNNESLSDQVVSSALRYRTQAPLVDALLNDLGLPASDSKGLMRFANDTNQDPKAEL